MDETGRKICYQFHLLFVFPRLKIEEKQAKNEEVEVFQVVEIRRSSQITLLA